ncbi:MAG: NUDIX hydrolase [Clostridia bacterium]|nr:NUDIX hydrolase [Clostridia bacterium]
MHITLSGDQLYVAVDLMILTYGEGKLRLLLSRRINPPFDGLWALPGRFVALEESAEDAARRLMEEMLPIGNAYLEQLYTFTQVGRDPRGRVISVGYLAIVSAGGLDGKLAGTPLHRFDIDTSCPDPILTGEDGRRLGKEELAFDHESIIRMGITRLQGKLDYTSIGFRFLRDTECFSLGELQDVHEAILGKKLDDSNFRRGILAKYEKTGRIVQTEKTARSGRGRPSGLYCLIN